MQEYTKMQSTTTNTAAFPSRRLRSQLPIPASDLKLKASKNWQRASRPKGFLPLF